MLLLLLACAALSSEPTTLDGKLAAFLDERGVDPADCGSVAYHNGDSTCDETDAAALQCFADAWASCTPSRLDLTSDTIEGDVIYATYVVWNDGGCAIEAFTDSTDDAYSAQEVTQDECDDLVVVDNDPTCDTLAPDGCISAGCDGSDCG